MGTVWQAWWGVLTRVAWCGWTTPGGALSARYQALGVGPVQSEMRLSSGGPHVGGRVIVVAIVRNSVEQELTVVELLVPADVVEVP